MTGLAAPSSPGGFHSHLVWAEEVAIIRASAPGLLPAARRAVCSVLESVLAEAPPSSDIASSARALLAALR